MLLNLLSNDNLTVPSVAFNLFSVVENLYEKNSLRGPSDTRAYLT